MKLSDYRPDLYEKNVEMNALIMAEEVELEDSFKIELENAFKDNFPKVATKNGIENFEALLGIELDNNRDNLEYRRNKVISILSTTVPLTYRWLEGNLINLVGANNFEIKLDYNNYKLVINVASVYRNTAETIYAIYRPLIPSNLIFNVNLFETEYTHLYVGTILREGEHILMKGEE